MLSKDIYSKGLIFSRRFLGVRGRGSAFFFLLLIILLIQGGCGFQIQRNRLHLVNDAQSVAISSILNSSFIPKIDLAVRDFLNNLFVQHLISTQTQQDADLLLNIEIESITMERSDYSLDGVEQIYEFVFSVQGRLTVFDTRSRAYYLSKSLVHASHSIKTGSSDLISSEKEKGDTSALENFSEQIFAKISNQF